MVILLFQPGHAAVKIVWRRFPSCGRRLPGTELVILAPSLNTFRISFALLVGGVVARDCAVAGVRLIVAVGLCNCCGPAPCSRRPRTKLLVLVSSALDFKNSFADVVVEVVVRVFAAAGFQYSVAVASNRCMLEYSLVRKSWCQVHRLVYGFVQVYNYYGPTFRPGTVTVGWSK